MSYDVAMRAMVAEQTDKRPLKILVCDDERHIVRLIQVNLERLGHAVTCTYNGIEAIDRLGRESYDLVLLDVVMPLLDGFEVLRWIRQQAHLRDAKVFMLTVRDGDADVIEGYQQGADKYLSKPAALPELFNMF